MHDYTLYFTNQRIINASELPCFYNFQSPRNKNIIIEFYNHLYGLFCL